MFLQHALSCLVCHRSLFFIHMHVRETPIQERMKIETTAETPGGGGRHSPI